MMNISSKDVGTRMIIKGRFSSTLMEAEILEASKDCFKAKYVSGAVSWDKKSDYEIVERLPAQASPIQIPDVTADCVCGWQGFNVSVGVLTWNGGTQRTWDLHTHTPAGPGISTIMYCPRCRDELAPPAEPEEAETLANRKPTKKERITAVLKNMRYWADEIDQHDANIMLGDTQLREGLGFIEEYFKTED